MMSEKNDKPKAAFSDTSAANYIGVSVSWLRQKRCYGAIGKTIKPPKFVKIGRSVRYLKSDLDAWLQSLPKYEHTTAANGGKKHEEPNSNAA